LAQSHPDQLMTLSITPQARTSRYKRLARLSLGRVYVNENTPSPLVQSCK